MVRIEEVQDESDKFQQTGLDVPEDDEKRIHLQFTWSGKAFTLDVPESDRWVSMHVSRRLLTSHHRVFDLKQSLEKLTSVPPERQKVLGLVKGKLPSDDVVVCV